jgi:hypothetical protein
MAGRSKVSGTDVMDPIKATKSLKEKNNRTALATMYAATAIIPIKTIQRFAEENNSPLKHGKERVILCQINRSILIDE